MRKLLLLLLLPLLLNAQTYEKAGIEDLQWGYSKFDRSSRVTPGATVELTAFTPVNVKALGVIGDGVTDDSAAIQAVIDSCEVNGGGTVYLPAGTYLLGTGHGDPSAPHGTNQTLLMPKDGVNIIGDGMGKTILKVADGLNAGDGFGVLDGRDATNQYDVTSISDVIYSDFTIDFNGSNNPHDSGMTHNHNNKGIGIYVGDNITIQNISFLDNVGTNSVFIGSPGASGDTTMVENVRVENCYFYKMARDDNQTDHSSLYVIADDVVISGNVFRNTDTAIHASNNVAALDIHGSRISVSGNTVENMSHGIYVGGVVESHGFSVSDNVFRNVGLGVALWGDATDDQSDWLISDNIILVSPQKTATADGVIIAQGHYGLSDVSITDNVIRCLDPTSVYTSRGIAIVHNIDNFTITGNKIYDFPRQGIYIYPNQSNAVSKRGMRNVQVSMNTVQNCGQNTTDGAGSLHRAGISIGSPPEGDVGGGLPAADVSNEIYITYNTVVDTFATHRMSTGIAAYGDGSEWTVDGNDVAGWMTQPYAINDATMTGHGGWDDWDKDMLFTGNPFNVVKWGATGDGTTDDTAAIQAAIDACEAVGGGVVQIPAGTYLVDDLVIDSDNVSIIGAGKSTVLEFPDGTITASGPSIRARMIQVDGDNFSISNVAFDCNEDGQSAWDEQVFGIRINAANNTVVRDCSFSDIMGDGIYLSSALDDEVLFAGPTNTLIDNCEFYADHDNRQGISIIVADGLTISDCYFYHMTKSDMPAAIDIEPGRVEKEVHNVLIVGNRFIAEERAEHNYGILVTATPGGGSPITNISIIDNIFSGGFRYGIYLAGYSTSAETTTGIVVSGNIMDNMNYSGGTAYSGGIFVAGTGDVLIEKNTLNMNGSWDDWASSNRACAISVYDPNGTVTIANNALAASDSCLIGILTRSVSGTAAGRVDIKDNALTGFQMYGILHALDGDIDGNTINLVGVSTSPATHNDGIYTDTSGARISQNTIIGGNDMRYGITADSSDVVGISAWGNIITNALTANTRYYGNPVASAAGDGEIASYWGDSSPEGAVTASIGSIYQRTDGGAGTSLYVKESGTGNTGWSAIDAGTPATHRQTWTMPTTNAPSPAYIGGFYDFGGTANDMNPAINFGTATVGYAAHFMVVCAAGATDTEITVTGTSITDAGVRTTSDTEVLELVSASADVFYETSKKWLGQVSVEKTDGTDRLVNYGWCKYWDNGNTDFTVTGGEALWMGDNTSTIDVIVYHHQATGWTYNAGAEPDPPEFARLSDDHVTEVQTRSNEYGAWKRTGLSTLISGSTSEGIIIGFTFTNGACIEYGQITMDYTQ